MFWNFFPTTKFQNKIVLLQSLIEFIECSVESHRGFSAYFDQIWLVENQVWVNLLDSQKLLTHSNLVLLLFCFDHHRSVLRCPPPFHEQSWAGSLHLWVRGSLSTLLWGGASQVLSTCLRPRWMLICVGKIKLFEQVHHWKWTKWYPNMTPCLRREMPLPNSHHVQELRPFVVMCVGVS